MSGCVEMADPKIVGAEIRRLLFSLHAEGHTEADEKSGVMNYNTDALRKRALEEAGFCFTLNGEMAPACGCTRKKSV